MSPSSYQGPQNEDLRPLIDKFLPGLDSSAAQRIKLFKLIWDAIGSEFGARHELYERNYCGNNEQIRLDALGFGRLSRSSRSREHSSSSASSEYDLDGWTEGTCWR